MKRIKRVNRRKSTSKTKTKPKPNVSIIRTEGLGHFPTAEIATLKNGATIVLKPLFKGTFGPYVMRFVAFPHRTELEKFPGLKKLRDSGGFDAGERTLVGGIGFIKVRWLMFCPSMKEGLKKNNIPFHNSSVVITDIQLRNPFVHLKPNRIRKRFWHVDDLLLEKLEKGLKAGGIKSVVVAANQRIPPTQKAKLYNELLESHGYTKIKYDKERQVIFWVKEI